MTTAAETNSDPGVRGGTVVERLEGLLRFGALMMRAGDTAFRVRESMGAVARRLGLEGVSVQLGLGGVLGSARRGGEAATLMREVGAPGVNAWRIGALAELSREGAGPMDPRELAARVAAIEGAGPRYSVGGTGAAIGAASGAFAVLNGGLGPEVVAAAVGGGVGQCVRSLLLRRRINQYAVAAVSAAVASGLYCVVAMLAARTGLGDARHAVGFVSSVLFLVPGFPLVAAVLDLLQHETAAGLTRLAYATMLLLAATFGLSVVIVVAGLSGEGAGAAGRGAVELWGPVKFLVRGVASLAGGCGFAILYNSSWRNVVHVGVLAVIGNEARLGLRDAGMPLPGATLLGAMAVGLAASVAGRWFREPRIALTVPGVIMMVPGVYAYRTLVLFNHGDLLGGLAAGVMVGFVVAGMALGLAAARFVSQPGWLRE